MTPKEDFLRAMQHRKPESLELELQPPKAVGDKARGQDRAHDVHHADEQRVAEKGPKRQGAGDLPALDVVAQRPHLGKEVARAHLSRGLKGGEHPPDDGVDHDQGEQDQADMVEDGANR